LDVKITYVPNAKQLEAHNAKEKLILYGGAVGGGKALALSTPIPTIHGWATMGSLLVGDTVFDENGQPCRVLACSPIMKGRPCHRVVFDDGSEIVADADHLWYTQTGFDRERNSRRTEAWRAKRKRNRKSYSTGKRPDLARMNRERKYKYKKADCGGVRTTSEIASSLMFHRTRNHSIPNTSPLWCPEANLSIPPYTLGAWLGDGSSWNGGITSADPQVIDEIRKDGYVVRKRGAKYSYGILGLQKQLRVNGLYRNKHIPLEYLRASEEQRFSLLQGLMDTDGFVGKSGKANYYSSSRRLIDGACELVRSFGIRCRVLEGRAKLNGKDCGPFYTICFRTGLLVCRLDRKKERIKPVLDSRVSNRYIVDVVPVESVPVRCIKVDSPNRLFLAGESMIPTHNSVFLVMDAIWQCLMWANNRVGLYRWELSTFGKTTYKTLEEWLLTDKMQPGITKLIKSHNQVRREITFFNGSQIVYGGLKPSASTSGDILSIARSLECSSCYIDEVTDIPEMVFRFISSTRIGRIRQARNMKTNHYGWPPARLVCTCNPHLGWVKTEFIDRELPNHRFIPATIEDNRENLAPGWADDAKAMFAGDPDLMKRWIHGDWTAVVDYDCIYQPGWLELARRRSIKKGEPIQFGVDVGGGGPDPSVIACRWGMHSEYLYRGPGGKTTDTTRKVAMLSDRLSPEIIRVDAIGIGQGVYDQLDELGYPVEAFIGGEKANDPRFLNRRAESYWGLRNLLEKGKVDLPDDSVGINELGVIKYTRSASDKKIQVEAKAAIKKRLGHSPDHADAVVYAFADSGFDAGVSMVAGA